ncbi:MAG: hypothetical protein HY927_01205 [Elusimicrobia bacterium]|nr:hypothetical protein [Elusimicrobiota bacterium]
MADFVMRSDGRKYLWDGKAYASSREAEDVRAAYVKDGFEVQVSQEGGTFLVYSRRVAAQQTA